MAAPILHHESRPLKSVYSSNNFWRRRRFICLVCSNQSRREYDLSSKSKYILIVLSFSCKSIISSTSDGTKRSPVQWFVVTTLSNIKHWSFKTAVNIKHVLNFGSIFFIRMGGSLSQYVRFMGVIFKKLG